MDRKIKTRIRIVSKFLKKNGVTFAQYKETVSRKYLDSSTSKMTLLFEKGWRQDFFNSTIYWDRSPVNRDIWRDIHYKFEIFYIKQKLENK